MVFIDPSLEEVYKTLSDNKEIIKYLKKENLLITRESLLKEFSLEEVDKLSSYIRVNNVSTIYNVAEILLKNKEKIKEMSLDELASNQVGWDGIAKAFNLSPFELEEETYRYIVFTYKYCYASSFFQNNKDMFIPENDFFEMEKNPAAMAFYDAAMKEFDKLDDVLNKCAGFLDFDKIPWELISYLTQLLGFEKSTFGILDEDEKKFRELAKNIIDIYRVKGTNYSFNLFFNFLGYDIKIKEFFFDRRLFFTRYTGNIETDSDDKNDFEFYLTVLNPEDNKLTNISVNEIVMPNDITKQYQLDEFNDLVKKYGVEAVLGYSPIYIDEKTKLPKIYTDKVYKYFKTNYVYYDISTPGKNLSPERYRSIVKCLDFLTPSFIKRKKLRSKGDSGLVDDEISFDDGGSLKPDKNGNYGKLGILDDEDWDSQHADLYTQNINNKLYCIDSNTRELKEYNNSLYNSYENDSKEISRYNKFRLPIRNVAVNKSMNRFLTGALKTPYVKAKRIKYYVGYKKSINDKLELHTFYTTPPKFESYLKLSGTIYSDPNKQKEISLTGKAKEGKTVKEMVKNANSYIKIDKVINQGINEYIESEEYKKLSIVPTMSRTLNKIKEFYLNEKTKSELNGYPICNTIESAFNINDLKGFLGSSNESIKELEFNNYVLFKDTSNSSFYLYKYGSFAKPIYIEDSNINNGECIYSNEDTYKNYVDSFFYKLIKIYNNKEDPLNYMVEESNNMNEIINKISIKRQETIEKFLPLDYVTKTIHKNKEDDCYYSAIRVPNNKTNSLGDILKFKTLEEAKEYANKKNNMEFSIDNDDNLYCYEYELKKGTLIYSKADEKLYQIDNFHKIKKIDDFLGRIDLENNQLCLYDDFWNGYDEQADEEDFLFYNKGHIINWKALNIVNKKIGRPIKSVTDKYFENNKLYKNVIDEICQKTYSFFQDLEKVNEEAKENIIIPKFDYIKVDGFSNISPKEYKLYEKNDETFVLSSDGKYEPEKVYYTNSCLGILNCINENISKSVVLRDTYKKYYYNIEDFLLSYYNIMHSKDFSTSNFPKEFVLDYPANGDSYPLDKQLIIAKAFNNIVIQISSLANYLLETRNMEIAKDDYGDFLEIYSEFKEFINLFSHYIDYGKDIVIDFLQDYYYNKLLSLYREKFIEDSDLDFYVKDVNPMFTTLNLLERLDGKCGRLNLPLTINNNFRYNNDGIKEPINIKFDNIFFSKNSMVLRTTHKIIVDSMKQDCDEYYNMLYSNPKLIKEELNDYFKCIKPTFLYYDKSYYNNKKELTNWQKNRTKFNKYFTSAKVESYDKNGRPLIINNKIVDGIGKEIIDENEKAIRIKDVFENGWMKIIINLDEDFEGIFDNREINNIYGFLQLRKLDQTFIDNEISFPKSFNWIDKDQNNLSTEFISFGDDREVGFYENNDAINDSNIKEYTDNLNSGESKITIDGKDFFIPKRTCTSFINENKKIVLRVPKNNIDNNLEIDSIQLIIS